MWFSTCTVPVPVVVPPQLQDFALLLVELDVNVGIFLQSYQVPLGGSMTLWCISHSSKVIVDTFRSIIHIVNEDVKQDGPAIDVWEYTKTYWSPIRL